MRARCMSVTIFAVVLTMAVAGQDRVEVNRHATIEEALRAHHVSLTRPELLAALRGKDPDARWLAAQKLAQDRDFDAIPAIETALSLEKVPATRVNTAFALAQLRSPDGTRMLQNACKDDSIDPSLRMRAANYLIDLDDEDKTCLDDLMRMLQAGIDPQAQIQSMSVLQRSRLSPDEAQRYFQALVSALSSSVPAVRIAASHALAETKSSSAISYLQSAAVAERDATVRAAMQRELRRLEISAERNK